MADLSRIDWIVGRRSVLRRRISILNRRLVISRGQKSKIRTLNFSAVTVIALVISPLSGFDTTLNVNFISFFEVLLTYFSAFISHDYGVPLGVAHTLSSGSVGVSLVGG